MQKDLGWMVGSILEKLRDLNIKNRSWLEILLNYHGPRVDSEKTQGLFSKRPERTGIFYFGPSDPDLAALDEGVHGI